MLMWMLSLHFKTANLLESNATDLQDAYPVKWHAGPIPTIPGCTLVHYDSNMIWAYLTKKALKCFLSKLLKLTDCYTAS